MIDISEYKSTGNLAVDMVANCVAFYRKRNMPLKTVYLSKRKYNQFRDFVAKEKEKVGEEFDKDSILEMDSVSVVEGSQFSIKELYVDFYIENE